MRFATYLKYAAAGGAALILASGAWSQAQSSAGAPESQKTSNGDCAEWNLDNAQTMRQMKELQREMRAHSREINAQARQLRAEVKKEMAENLNRGEMSALAARLQSETAGIEHAAQVKAAKAQEIFAQNSLLDNGEDTGWLGVEVTEVTDEIQKQAKLPQQEGVYVSEVAPDSPAAKAGLQARDVIVNYDGHVVEGTVQFRRLVRETPPGRTVTLAVYRNGAEQNLKIQVGNREQHAEKEFGEILPLRNFNLNFRFPEFFPAMGPTLGIEAEDISGQLANYFHVPGGAGVLVEQVTADTPAARAGLKAGDVIIKAGNASVKTIGDLRDQLREQREQKTITLTIIRGGSQTMLTVTLEHPEEHQLRTRSAAL